MQPIETPANFSLKTECKKLLALPCLKTISFTIILQIILLGIFILIINCDIFHPIQWFIQLFGFHWLKHVPLIVVLFGNGLIMSKSLITAKRKYYCNRFKWLLDNGLQKVILLVFQILLGLLTAWSFMNYLSPAYRSIFIEIKGITCVNSFCVFLIFVGIAGGCYHFFVNCASQDVLLEFECVPKTISIQLRESFIGNVSTSFKKTLIPTIIFTLVYWTFNGFINRRLAFISNAAIDERMNSFFNTFTNVNLLLFAWFILAELFFIMALMRKAFSIFVTSDFYFPISCNATMMTTNQVTLVGALSMDEVPVVQKLAAFDFYNLTKIKSKERKHEIFALSQPGGHPYNWNQLSSQCLSLINAYVDDMNASWVTASVMLQNSQPILNHTNSLQPSATELAQRILIHQYNEKHNIRRLRSDLNTNDTTNSATSQAASTVARINENFEQIVQRIKQFVLNIFQSVPGLYYMFGEPESAKTTYLLSHADLIIWIVQGLAYVSATSLTDDPYGIVQLTLPEITKTFLRLKFELDKLLLMHLSAKNIDSNLIALKNALKRSLHKICNTFADYLPEIVADTNDLPQLRAYLYQPC